MSMSDKLLIMAYRIAAHTYGDPRASFTIEQLTLEAWKSFPDTFGLRGFKNQYPNTKTVSSCISSKRTRFRQWVERVGPNRLKLNKEGVKIAAKLIRGVK